MALTCQKLMTDHIVVSMASVPEVDGIDAPHGHQRFTVTLTNEVTVHHVLQALEKKAAVVLDMRICYWLILI